MHTWFIRLLRSFSNHLLEELCSIESRSMQMMWSSFGGHQQVTSTSHLIYYISFGEASGLRTNIQKSSVHPIQCLEEDKAILHNHLPCQISDFPCKYLGVPLSPLKLTLAQVQPLVDKVVDRLQGWKADLTKAGRCIMVQFVLTSMMIYLLLALDLPP